MNYKSISMALAAIGYRSLSMSAASIGPVKAMLLTADLKETAEFLAPMIDQGDDRQPLREQLRAFAEARGVQF